MYFVQGRCVMFGSCLFNSAGHHDENLWRPRFVQLYPKQNCGAAQIRADVVFVNGGCDLESM